MLSFRASLKTQRLLPHLRLYDERLKAPSRPPFLLILSRMIGLTLPIRLPYR